MATKSVEVLWPSAKEETVEKKSEKIRVAAYCRLSTVVNEKHVYSLENQLNHYTYYIANHKDYKLMGLYYDGNISGTTINDRPGFKRLLRHCNEGLIDLVITKSISRFSRNAKDLLEVVDHLSELGIPVIFEKENINTLERKNKFYLTTLAGLSQEEIISISSNVTWSKNNRAESGEPIYRRLFGYEIILTRSGRKPKILDDEAEIVREIFRLFLNGMKINQIARLLTDKSVQTRNGQTIWTHSSVKYILKNRAYIGEQVINENRSIVAQKAYFLKGIDREIYVIRNAYPPIVNSEVFEKAQEKISTVKPIRFKEMDMLHPCSKRVWCGLCDAKYLRYYKKNQSKWACRIKTNQARLCDSPRLNDEKLLLLMKEAMQHRYDFNDPRILKKLINELERVNKNDRFEFHRLSMLSQLQIVREKLRQTPDNRELVIEKERLEKDLIDFERVATMIEDDRKYREQALESLEKSKSAEDFIKRADIAVIRAWVMELVIFSINDYKVRWYDDLYTTFGKCEIKKMEMKVKRTDLVEGDMIINPKDKKPGRIVKEYFDEEVRPSEEPNILKHGGDIMRAETVEELSFKLEDRIREEFRESGPKPSSKKIRVGVYARISTDDPRQLGSLEAQMAYYTYAILKNPKYRMVQVYYDEGISGTKAENRPGFQQMMIDCRKSKIDRIITKSISRFARNTVDCLEYVRELKSLGVSILFEKEEIDSADNDGEILLTVYSALAQEESRNLGESLSWSKRKRAERGKITLSTPPYGYVFDKDRNWMIDKEKAGLVNEMYDDYLLGISMEEISKRLNDKGIPSPTKRSWRQPTVSKILRNPAYKGELVYQKEYVSDPISKKRIKNDGDLPIYFIENNHEVIIEEEKWEMVQEKIDSKRNKHKVKVGNRRELHTRKEFFKVFRCQYCDCPVIHIPETRGTEKHYWRCRVSAKKERTDNCHEKGIREENIEHTFMAMLLELKNSKEVSDLVNRVIEDVSLKPHEEEELRRLEKEIEIYYQKLYETVEEGKKHGEDTGAIKVITDHIMDLHGKIRSYEDRKERVSALSEELKWLRKELLALEPFNPKKERVLFRGDIFTRLIKSGTFLADDVIQYQLSIGVSWNVRDSRKEYWKLPIKK